LLISVENESKALITQNIIPVKERIITVEDMTTHCLRKRMRNAVIEKVRKIRSLFTVCFSSAKS